MLKKLSPAEATPAKETPSAPAAKPASGRKALILRALAGLAAALLILWGGHWLIWGRHLVSTDDAFVGADFSSLAARVGGTVQAVRVAENASVNQGDVLVEIDSGDYVLALDAATHRVETQKAALARIGQQAQAQLANIAAAKAALAREEAAFIRASSLNESAFASAKVLEEARAARDSAAAGLAAAEAQLNVLKAQAMEATAQLKELETARAKAERDLSFTQVKAPFAGIVGNRAVEPGQYVQPGTRLMALVPQNSAYVEANFKETQIGKLKPGQKVEIEVDAFGSAVDGEVESIAPASGAQFALLPPENATGNFTKIVQRVPVRIRITDAKGLELRPGLSVVVTVDTAP